MLLFKIAILIALIICILHEYFFRSFHDKCYKKMESQGYAVFGGCDGLLNESYENQKIKCMNCPYFDPWSKHAKKKEE